MAAVHTLSTEDYLPESPPPKRRRFQHVNHSSASLAESHFCFPDGDFVLNVTGHLFKIHRRQLMCSTVFADMLSIPQPEMVESIEGCPCVALQDSPQDWIVALRWIYRSRYEGWEPSDNRVLLLTTAPNLHTLSEFNSSILSFDSLAGAIRISTKYDIGALRERCIKEMLSRWPEDLTSMNMNSLPHAAGNPYLYVRSLG